MASTVAPGTPSLIDVTVSDIGAAKDFYTGLFGWSYDEKLDPTGHYVYAVANDKVVAGLRPGQPNHPFAWSLYLGIDDAAATAQKVRNAGGQVIYEKEAPDQGNVLVAADPAGAFVGFWQPTAKWSFQIGEHNTLVWAELNVRDEKAADEFYVTIFGYDQQQIGDGDNYDYKVWSLGDVPRLGRMRMGSEFPAEVPPHWLVYIGVDPQVGTDAIAERAVKLGATISREPFDIPAGRVALLEDVFGATFAVVDGSKKADRS